MKSKIKLNIEGKNIERFIHRLISHGIEILNMNYTKNDQVRMEVYQSDYQKIIELKTIYEISVTDSSGFIRLKKQFNMNRILLFGLLVGIAVLYVLSHMISDIEIVHTNKEVQKLLIRELEEHGMKARSFRKSFEEIEKIKTDIINEHRDKIEWLEIEAVGTKYVVRVETRELEAPKKQYEKQHVVAKKNAVVKKVIAENGVIIKEENTYVKAGDVIISGEIMLNDEVKNTVAALGTVYGEVWYTTTVEYPFTYYEEKETGRKKTVYAIQIFNHQFDLPFFSSFEDKEIKEQVLFSHTWLPFRFVRQEQKELDIIDTVNTEEEAIDRAEKIAREKIESQLNDNEKIIRQKNLKVDIKESKIVIDIFFTVLEDITEYQKIEENIPEEIG